MCFCIHLEGYTKVACFFQEMLILHLSTVPLVTVCVKDCKRLCMMNGLNEEASLSNIRQRLGPGDIFLLSYVADKMGVSKQEVIRRGVRLLSLYRDRLLADGNIAADIADL